MAKHFGVVTGPIIRQIEALFTLYNCHGNGDNFWCRNEANHPSYRSTLRALQLPQERGQPLVS
ncbi:hypothetical protein L484_000831 [Morus notabilis]|uniref:Uncharacterized protein n=1 Tax=Morus notabilis TaxID=981085 RepID=W9RGC8_9ROSA|nr:hypothetical protein L484_000831 [Morus notabilis]